MDATALTHEPLIPPILVSGVPRLDPDHVAALSQLAATDVADLVGPLYTMDPAIRLLTGGADPGPSVAGRALTVKAWPGDNLAIHGALARVEEGDVLVVDWRGHVGACGSGARSLVGPQQMGLRAVVVDGAWRDIRETAELGLPLFARGIGPTSPPKLRAGEINVPVACGGVVVAPGDLVVGDAECVAVVPRTFVPAVAAAVAAAPGAEASSPDARRAKAEARRRYFDRVFTEASGTVRAWAG